MSRAAQIAAETLGLPPEQVNFELGDTMLPEAPLAGSQPLAGLGLAATQSPRLSFEQAKPSAYDA